MENTFLQLLEFIFQQQQMIGALQKENADLKAERDALKEKATTT